MHTVLIGLTLTIIFIALAFSKTYTNFIAKIWSISLVNTVIDDLIGKDGFKLIGKVCVHLIWICILTVTIIVYFEQITLWKL